MRVVRSAAGSAAGVELDPPDELLDEPLVDGAVVDDPPVDGAVVDDVWALLTPGTPRANPAPRPVIDTAANDTAAIDFLMVAPSNDDAGMNPPG